MIFYVNLPVAVALAVAALKVIPTDTEKPRWRGLDLRGALLATASLGALVYAITQGAERRLGLDRRRSASRSPASPGSPRFAALETAHGAAAPAASSGSPIAPSAAGSS